MRMSMEKHKEAFTFFDTTGSEVTIRPEVLISARRAAREFRLCTKWDYFYTDSEAVFRQAVDIIRTAPDAIEFEWMGYPVMFRLSGVSSICHAGAAGKARPHWVVRTQKDTFSIADEAIANRVKAGIK